MVNNKRIFHIFGKRDLDAKIELWWDGKLIKSGPIDHHVTTPFDHAQTPIYSVESPCQIHGGIKVKLTVLSGSITLGRTIVQYPAVLKETPSTRGSVWFYQPISDPKFSVVINGSSPPRSKEDIDLGGEWHYHLNKGNVIEYTHLAYNGPGYWIVTDNVDVDQFQTTGIFVNIQDLVPVWEYPYHPPSFEKLIEIVKNLS
jgi:hypothetical protein